MPTYTYQCKKCEHTQDVFHSMSESPRVTCGACGSRAMKRLIGTGAGIIFKGSGFYETDYKGKKNGKSEASGGEKKESKSESKAEAAGKSESKGSGKKTGGPDSTKAA